MSLKNKITSVLQNKTLKKYTKNTAWLIIEKLVAMIIAYVVARYLGEGDFGLLNAAQSFVMLFSVLATLGLDTILVRNLVKDENNKNFWLGTAFILKILAAIITLIITITVIQFTTEDELNKQLVYLIIISTVFQSFNVLDFYFQSKVQARFVVFSRLSTLGITSVLKVIFIIYKVDLIWFAALISLEMLLFILGLIYNFQRLENSIFKWKFKKKYAKILLKDSAPLLLSGLFVTLYMRIDQVMIKEMISAEENGLYAIAVRLSETWYFIPSVVCASLFPAIIKWKEESKKLYYRHLQTLYDIMYWVSVIFALFMTFSADYIMDFLFENQYKGSAEILKIHVWAGVFVSLGVARGRWILTENLQRFSLVYISLGAICNIIINWFAIPKYGGVGAAWATLISYAVSGYFTTFIFKPTRICFYMLSKTVFGISLIEKIKKIKTLHKNNY